LFGRRPKIRKFLADSIEKHIYILPDLPDVPAFVENSCECRQQED